MNIRKGRLVAVSGLDGCGKTELCRRIGEYLIGKGERIWFSSAISGHSTTIGRQIGDILRDPQTECPIPPDAEHALMIAARVIAEKNVIEPALASGRWVVSDRYGLCGLVYQRWSDGKFMKQSLYNARLAAFGLTRVPDLEVILDIDPAHPHKPHDPDNRLETRSMQDWVQMRSMYRSLSISEPNTMMVDGSLPQDQIFEKVKKYLDRLIENSV